MGWLRCIKGTPTVTFPPTAPYTGGSVRFLLSRCVNDPGGGCWSHLEEKCSGIGSTGRAPPLLLERDWRSLPPLATVCVRESSHEDKLYSETGQAPVSGRFTSVETLEQIENVPLVYGKQGTHSVPRIYTSSNLFLKQNSCSMWFTECGCWKGEVPCLHVNFMCFFLFGFNKSDCEHSLVIGDACNA